MELLRRYKHLADDMEEEEQEQITDIALRLVSGTMRKHTQSYFGREVVRDAPQMEKEIFAQMIETGIINQILIIIDDLCRNCKIRYLKNKEAGCLTGVMNESALKLYEESGVVPECAVKW